MGFLKKLFGGGSAEKSEPQDPNGIYLYFRSKRAPDAVTRVRVDKQYDLNSADSGYVWHKTIVDHKYFSRVHAVVYFDRGHQVTRAEVDGGELISAAEYEAALALAAKTEEEAAANGEAQNQEDPAGGSGN